MNNRKQDKNPLFAEVELTGDEFKHAPYNGRQRLKFLKLVYPNKVTLVLPCDISASQLEQYIGFHPSIFTLGIMNKFFLLSLN